MTFGNFRLTAKFGRCPLLPGTTGVRPRLKRLGGKQSRMGLALFHWPAKLHKSNEFLMFIFMMLLVLSPVGARPSKRSIYDRLTKGLIRPLPCYDNDSGKSGICMFTLNCFEAKGTPLTTCKDGIFLGSCCNIPSDSELSNTLLELQGNDLNPNPDFPTSSWRWTSTTSHPPSSSATQTSVVTSVVTSFGVENTTAKTATTTIPSTTTPEFSRTSFSDNELISGVLDVMNSEKNFTGNNSVENAWKVTPLQSSTLLDVVTRKPIVLTTQKSTTPELDIIDWAIISDNKDNNDNNVPTVSATETSIKTTEKVSKPYVKTTVSPRTTSTTARSRRTTVKRRPTTTTNSTTTTTTTTEFDLANTDFREACGRSFSIKAPRMVGSQEADFGKWPWQVSLRMFKERSFQHKCGAALLNENWAITAAHCVDKVPVEHLQVRLGDFDMSDDNEPLSHVDRQVQIIAKHPDFNPRNFENDVALVRFYEPAKFQLNIIPICLPQDDNSFINDTAYVTGWGRLYNGGPLPHKLHEAEIPIISNLECEKLYRKAGYIESIPDIFICAGMPGGGVDSCEGDSGGPMMIRSDQRWYLAGIISWGIGCAEPNQPGVYTRVSRFRDWINAILVF